MSLPRTTSIDAVWETPAGPPASLNLAFDGASRFAGWVLEGEGRLDGPVDTFRCPTGAECTSVHDTGLKRSGTRFVREIDDQQMVLALGDVGFTGETVQRANDVLGVSLSHDPRRFGRDPHVTASSVLALDSPAEVDVKINGAVLQHLHLNTGSYRLTDLPLLAGSNAVELAITTADGQTRLVTLDALGHDAILKPGETTWLIDAGIPSFVDDASRSYDGDDIVANGDLRIGLTPSSPASSMRRRIRWW